MRVRFIAAALTLCVVSSSAQDAYLVRVGTTVRIGNTSVERVLSVDPATPGTFSVQNKLSGKRYSVHSDEFALSMVFAGFGPAEGKAQNGDNPSVLTARSFRLLGTAANKEPDGTQILSMRYGLDRGPMRLRVTVHYAAGPKESVLRKWLEVSDSLGGVHFLDRMDVEDLTFNAAEISRGQFGQPVFVGDLFIGVEYPGVENTVSDCRVRSGYVVGEKLGAVPLVSEKAVLGGSDSGRELERTFMRYVETIKVRGTRPFLLYNSWYDLRHPSRTNDPAHAMTEPVVLDRLGEFRKHMTEKHGITLDAFVLDDGWDNVESIWRIDSTTFPRGFSRVAGALGAEGTKLGLWASPFSGYDMREKRVQWGATHGYERTGEFLCFAGSHYGKEFRDRMVQYTRDYGIGYFKWDGFLLACNEQDHGHLPGVYSRRALISTFAGMMAAVREVNPDIFINITVGSWLSPWWLRYADCVWMQGEDYGYAEEVPSLTPRDKAITYRDAVLWKDFRQQRLLFPVSSMMTHGIIKGTMNMLGGRNESLESFTNEVVMYFGRGVKMWELYVSPDVLSTDEWHAIASCVKWAREQNELLGETRMIGGSPLNNEPYGFAHSNGTRAFVLLRNPSVHPSTISVSLDRDLDVKPGGGTWRMSYRYPYQEVSGRMYRSADSLRVHLGSFEVVMIEMSPADAVPTGTPFDVRTALVNDSLVVFGVPGSTLALQCAGESKPRAVTLPGSSARVTVHDGGWTVAPSGDVSISASVEALRINAPAMFAVLLEPAGKLKEDEAPVVRAVIDGVEADAVVEQEAGAWFWIKIPVSPGKHEVSVSLKGVVPITGKAEAWLFWDAPLAAAAIAGAVQKSATMELPVPYPPSAEKQSLRVGTYTIGK